VNEVNEVNEVNRVSRRHGRRVRGPLARLCVLAVALVAWLAPGGPRPAGAHEGPGVLELLSAEPAGPMAVTYRVRLTYRSDGHAATGATVTVVAEQPGGAATTPVLMAPEGDEGVYAATVRFSGPGAWTVRVTAVSPPATLERLEELSAPPTTTTVATTTTVTTTTTGPATAVPAGSARGAGGGGGPGTSAAVVAAAVVAAALALTTGLSVRRRARRR
jgi:hypothetical protein